MNQGWVKKLDACEHRLTEIEKQMAEGGGDWQALAIEHGRLMPLVGNYRRWRAACHTLKQMQEAAADPELAELAQEEIKAATAIRANLYQDIRQQLSPKNADDARNCFIEIRAAVGGNESCLFAADLLRLYVRAADIQGWKTEIMSCTDSETGGHKEVILRIRGVGAYGRLKYESGAHRVQRVPQTESQGRLHTSVVTVAVMLEAAVEDTVALPPQELRIETFRASGAGGQHVNTTDSAVRITHLPTGVVAECQDDRSQHKNRDKAMAVLRARIIDKYRRERHEKEAMTRRLLVGSGDRSDRIRTYNFPQGRLTDHRIGLNFYNLAAIMEGEIDDILNALAAAAEAEELELSEYGGD